MLQFVDRETLGVLVEFPLKLENESNLRGKARNSFRLSRITKEQKSAVGWALTAPLRNSGLVRSLHPHGFELLRPVVVTLSRLARRAFDDDGTIGSLKHVRDAVAEVLGLPSDRDRRVLWLYSHGPPLVRGTAKIQGVRIEIRPSSPHAA